ncbi:MAG TPA: hypothetical protein DCO72_02485 [Ruminococcus sp.]|nr:hypothetical protein [Ruminococcus sp.]
MYLAQKNTTLDDELTKYSEQLYSKIVPQNVRDYIEMTTAKRTVKKPKEPQKTVSDKASTIPTNLSTVT